MIKLKYSGCNIFIEDGGKIESLFHQSIVTSMVDIKIRLIQYGLVPMLKMKVGESFTDNQRGDPRYVCTRIMDNVFQFEFNYIRHLGDKPMSGWERIENSYIFTVRDIEHLITEMMMEV